MKYEVGYVTDRNSDDDREYREKIHDLVIHSIFSYDDAQVVHYMSGKQVVDDIEKEDLTLTCCF